MGAQIASLFRAISLGTIFVGGGGQPSDSLSQFAVPVAHSQILTDDIDLRSIETPRPHRRDVCDEGGLTPHPQWQSRLDFTRFSDGDDPLVWIYKAERYFSNYAILEH